MSGSPASRSPSSGPIRCWKAPVRGLLFLVLSACWTFTVSASNAVPAVVTAHPLATEAGAHILRNGGNAFDAAVAATAVLGVVQPFGSGIGGGGFWLLHRASDQTDVMLDGRERAPLAATRDMYLDEHGEIVPGASIDGPLAAGVPGVPAALVHLSENYGRLPLQESLEAAIRLAQDGFPVDRAYRRMVGLRIDALRHSPAAAAQFLASGEIPEEGYILRQPDLATTLRYLAVAGRDGFYRGVVADRLVREVRAAGGIWSSEDLDAYRIVEREPVRGRYAGLEIVSAAPPSSGGVALLTILNTFQELDPGLQDGVLRRHLLVESMRRAYRDRARYLGDPDSVKIPVERLVHPYYGAGLSRDISPVRATSSARLSEALEFREGKDTTHFSVLDAEGNRVAATLSINYPFGSAFVPPGTGVLLNDEMDDFSMRPGAPNVYGLIGGEANAIAPGKRMLSSMSPTFVLGPETLVILGSPGGSRIITTVLHGILAVAEQRDLGEWIGAPRFHHQYLPDRIEYEPGAFTQDEEAQLRRLGHTLHPVEQPIGDVQLIEWNRYSGVVRTLSDPRGSGAGWVGGSEGGAQTESSALTSGAVEGGPLPGPGLPDSAFTGGAGLAGSPVNL